MNEMEQGAIAQNEQIDRRPQLFKKGQSGNPKGRKKGVTPTATKLREILSSNAENIVKAVVAQAICGDSMAQRLCFERLIPKVKDSIAFKIPDLTNKDSDQLVRELYAAMSHQEMTADEIKQILELVRTHRVQKEEDTAKHALLSDLKEFETEMRTKYESEL